MPMSSHASRWLVAAIAAPILLALLFLAPPLILAGLVALIGGLAWWEYFSAAFGPGRLGLLIVGLIGWTATAAGAHFFGPFGQEGGLFLAMALGGLYFVFNFPRLEPFFDLAGRFALGHAYLSLFLSFILLIFALEDGARWVLFTLLVTFLGDTGAYYTGRRWGRRLLYPAVSPKKTWEGLVGGVLASGLVAAILAATILPVAWHEVAGLGLFMGLWAAAGDLFESALKRASGIKDSGRIFLGHGGVWDRIDALLFNLPVVYLFIFFRVGL